MTRADSSPAVVLLAARQELPLEKLLGQRGFGVVRAPSGTLAVDWANDVRPDIIILEATLPEMSGLDACQRLRASPAFGRTVPLLLLLDGPPSPADRVAALRAGVWDFLRHTADASDIILMVDTYLQTKRNIESAHSETWVDSATGLHSRVGLSRRARELAALMTRLHGPLACVVFALDFEPLDTPKTGRAIARAARSSDVVGLLSATEFGILAPGTDGDGALEMTRRLGAVLRSIIREGGSIAETSTITAGFEAVANFTYAPTDPVLLIARASAAARSGNPVRESPWVRHFDGDAATRKPPKPPAPGFPGAPEIKAGRSQT